MPDDLPRQLLELLESLGLADAARGRSVLARVERLGRGLPQFQSVWVDALAQARILTPFQASEINAGRGAALRLGPYVLRCRISGPGYLRSYTAEDLQTGQAVCLSTMEIGDGSCAERLTELLGQLAARSAGLDARGLAPVASAGNEGAMLWIAQSPTGGLTAGEHLVRHGRMPPEVVLEIAKQTAAALAGLEQAGLPHGGISIATLHLPPGGWAVLSAPGVRPIVRPAEGFAHTDLAPEDYDGLAPERIDGGAAADARTDLYACGCLWWHLLSGRAAFAGGSATGKLRAHLSAPTADVRKLAPDTPPVLAEAIRASLERDPGKRPGSAAALADRFGPSTPHGRRELARWIQPGHRSSTPLHVPAARVGNPKWSHRPVAAAGISLVALAAVFWAMGHPFGPAPEGSPEASLSSPSGIPSANRLAVDPEPSPATRRLPGRVAGQTPARRDGSPEVVLPADDPIVFDVSQLADGSHVRSQSERRATVLIQGSPLSIAAEDVLFDGIDFVWRADPDSPAAETPAILRVEAGRIRFRRCTFQAASGETVAPVAIRWVFPVARGGLDLPAGRISLADCVFRRVEAALDAWTAAALTVDCNNLLHLGPGPFLRVDHTPPADEPVGLVLQNATFRQAGAVLQIQDRGTEKKPGTISIEARFCVFEPRSGEPLLCFVGDQPPDGLVQAVYWSGEGALVAPGAPTAVWRKPAGGQLELDDAAFSIAGLVRSRIQFAGSAGPAPEVNVAQRWQAPLTTSEPPGIRIASLPKQQTLSADGRDHEP